MAWNKHVESYKALNPDYDSKYLHTSKWNETKLRTKTELETNPYPPNFETVCVQSFTTVTSKNDTDKKRLHYEWIVHLRNDTSHRVYCQVLDRQENLDRNETYTVEMEIDDEEDEENDGKKKIVVHNVPRNGIFLTDKVFTADWLLPNSFRHEIMIPDHLMPKAWLNGPAPEPNFTTLPPKKGRKNKAE
jgi:hypothetical protein